MFLYVLICSYSQAKSAGHVPSKQFWECLPFWLETQVFKRDPKPLCALRPMLIWIFWTSWNMKTVRNQTKLKAYFDAIVVGSTAMILDTRTNVQTNVSIQAHQPMISLDGSLPWFRPKVAPTSRTWAARSKKSLAQHCELPTGRQKLWAAMGQNSSRQRLLQVGPFFRS